MAEFYPNENASTLWKDANDHFEQAAHLTEAAFRGFLIEANRTLYQKLLSIGDYKTAMTALEKLTDAVDSSTVKEWE